MRLQDRTVLVRLRIEAWGTTRQDKEANLAVSVAKNTSTKATRVTKRLCPEDALREVKSKAEAAREYLRNMTQPWTDDGARLLDASQLFNVQDELRRNFRPAWWAEVQKVISRLPEFRDTWGPNNLGDLYDPALYPTPERMEAEFTWTLDVLPLNPDAKELRTILGNDYVDEIQRRAERGIERKLWERLAEPIKNMAERLSQADSNFRDTLVSNIRDMVKLMPALNVTDDPALEHFRQEVENELTKYAPDTLRVSSRARRETAQKARDILGRMKDFMPEIHTDAPDDSTLALAQNQPEADVCFLL